MPTSAEHEEPTINQYEPGFGRAWPSWPIVVAESLHLPPVAAVTVAAFGFMAAANQDWPPFSQTGPFLIALIATQLAISIHNGYSDRDLDQRMKPWRPLPRGWISPSLALWLTGVLLAIGLAAALVLGPLVAAIVASGTGAGFVYNAWLKRTVWSWAPFCVGCPTLVVGAFAASNRLDPGLWQVYLLGAPLVIAVHLLDTMPDIESDEAAGVRGIAHRLGAAGSRLACLGLVGLGQVFALLFWPRGQELGLLFLISPGALALAGLVAGFKRWREFWLATMVSIVAVAIAWVQALGA